MKLVSALGYFRTYLGDKATIFKNNSKHSKRNAAMCYEKKRIIREFPPYPPTPAHTQCAPNKVRCDFMLSAPQCLQQFWNIGFAKPLFIRRDMQWYESERAYSSGEVLLEREMRVGRTF